MGSVAGRARSSVSSAPSGSWEPSGPPPPDMMRTYVMGFLYPGTDPPPMPEEELEALQRAHLGYMAWLAKEGTLILAGPFLDGTDLRGLCLYCVETVEEARVLGDGDPAVKAGRLRFEYHPWYGPRGITSALLDARKGGGGTR